MTLSTYNLSNGIEAKALNPFGLLIQGNGCDLREIEVAEIRRLAWEYRLIVLRGFQKLDRQNLTEYCTSWGDLLHWNFGVIFDLVVHENATNYLLTNGRVPFHWDGAFIETVPSFEIFQCLKAPVAGTGGETLFCDTIRVWENATPKQQEVWRKIEITYITESNSAHYGGKITVPLVSQHPKTGVTRLRFGEPLDLEYNHLTRLSMEIKGIPALEHEAFLKEMQRLIYSPQNCIVHQWQDGDLVIGDNHALLHARNKFLATTPRHLQRVHIL